GKIPPPPPPPLSFEKYSVPTTLYCQKRIYLCTFTGKEEPSDTIFMNAISKRHYWKLLHSAVS
ncbi:MAG: hypothetical protein ACTTH7_09770, partial [Treponema sp.]